jgi:hypothetical protein
VTDLNQPEWSGPFATGLFGTAYGLGDGRSLVLIGAPGNAVGSRPDRTWLWVVMKGRPLEWTRDFAFEEALRTNEDLAAVTGAQAIDGDRLFTAQEKNLGNVFRLLREAALAESASRRDRKAAL